MPMLVGAYYLPDIVNLVVVVLRAEVLTIPVYVTLDRSPGRDAKNRSQYMM